MRLTAGITRNVFYLGLVSFFTDASSEMLYPIIPIFITQTLGASPAIVGIIEGIAESTASLLKIWSGWFSDRLGVRKPLVFAGYGLAACTRPLLAIAYGWPTVLLARVLDRLGKGIRGAPRDALLADSIEPEFRGKAYGFHRSMDQSGAVVGPLLGLGLLHIFPNSIRTVFLIAFIPAAISTSLVALVREPRTHAVREPIRLRLSGLDPRFVRFLLIVGLFSLGNSSDAFLILRASQLHYTMETVVLLFAVHNIVYVASAFPAGILSDRIPRKILFGAGLLVFALVYAGFAFAPSARWLWLLFPAYGLYMGMTDGVSRALVVDLVPAGQRGTALGMHSAVLGLTAFPASLIAGILWQRLGPAAPFLYGSVMAALAALAIFATLGRRDTRTGPGSPASS